MMWWNKSHAFGERIAVGERIAFVCEMGLDARQRRASVGSSHINARATTTLWSKRALRLRPYENDAEVT